MSTYKNLLSPLIIILLLIISSAKTEAENIFLKDGSIINCIIINQTASSITVKLKNGRINIYNQKNVLRILFADIYMGKVLVRLTNGKSIEVYMVGEDEKTYTFRKELYKPDEFKIPRQDVLFMTRTNPVNLNGKPDERSIKLRWSPPYKAPEYYRIYIKGSKKETYKLAGSTRRASYAIRGLDKNTRYYFIVKGVDALNKESLPSNEIMVTTNKPPSPPSHGKCIKDISKDGKSLSARLFWRAASEGRENINRYHIYKKSESGKTKIGETNKTEYRIIGLNPKTTHYFTVRSVNSTGNESEDIWISTGKIKFGIGISGSFIIPFGYLKRTISFGYGGLVAGSVRNIFLFNLDFGIETGFCNLESSNEALIKGYTIPVLLRVNYRFIIWRTLTISPRLFAGFHYNNLTYQKKEYIFNIVSNIRYIFSERYVKKTSEPVVLGGLTLSYRFKRVYIIRLSADYGIYIKKGSLTNFLRFNTGAAYLLDIF